MIYTFLGSLPFSWINVYERRPVYIDFTLKEGIGAKNRKAPPGPCPPPLFIEKKLAMRLSLDTIEMVRVAGLTCV